MRAPFILQLALLPAAFALNGFEDHAYHPMCAEACGRSFWSAMLDCSDMDMGGMNHGSMNMSDNTPMTSSECLSKNEPYLTSLAYCFHIKCQVDRKDIQASLIETFWEKSSTQDPASFPAKWTFGEALAQVKTPPTRVWNSPDILNFTALWNESVWVSNVRTLSSVRYESELEQFYSVGLVVGILAIPIIITLAGQAPYMTGILDRLKPYLILPSTVGTFHVRPLPFLLGNAPTFGQALFIGAMLLANIVLTSVRYEFITNHGWYSTHYDVILANVCWRTGAIGLALLPVVILFSGRNNFLLWLTNWSHSTWLLLHRWIARIFAIQVILHSIFGLVLYTHNGSYKTAGHSPWWVWGIVGTLTSVIMLVGSGLYVRQRFYELFLISHIILAALTIVGSYYHVTILMGFMGHYQQWIWAAVAVWSFDRGVRVLRVLKNGIRRAEITELENGSYVRVDIKGVRWDATPGQHAYLYFPALSPLRALENHPFSLIPTSMLQSFRHSLIGNSSSDTGSEQGDVEKNPKINTAPLGGDTKTQLQHIKNSASTAGVTFFIRKSTGITKLLKSHSSALTLLDGPYSNNSKTNILRCDRLLLIGGGIGVTGLLPWVNTHPNVKLYWSMKQSAECLSHALDTALHNVAEKEILINRRFDARSLIQQEVENGWAKIGVVVCGPGALCDDVRAAVVDAGRKGPAIIDLEVDAYSW